MVLILMSVFVIASIVWIYFDDKKVRPLGLDTTLKNVKQILTQLSMFMGLLISMNVFGGAPWVADIVETIGIVVTDFDGIASGVVQVMATIATILKVWQKVVQDGAANVVLNSIRTGAKTLSAGGPKNLSHADRAKLHDATYSSLAA